MDVYTWPWFCAGEMGDWKLTDPQAKTLRDYLLRGGFLMLDDFWGTEEWNRFEESMKLVFPDRPIVEIENADSIFHTVYDLDERYQIPGAVGLAARDHIPERRRSGPLARHLRRQRPPDGGHVVQFRYRRFLGMGGRTALPGKILRAGDSHRRQLCDLRHDALNSASPRILISRNHASSP